MRRLLVPVTPPYEVVIGAGALAEAAAVVADRRRVAIVTQDAVAEHAGRVAADVGPRATVHRIGPGEQAKTMATVERLCRELAAGGLLRDDVVVAVGGGVVGDTAGLAAAVYHRGVAVVQVPTTLLAQVDAAIGGKTAVNLPEGKNLVGAFHQPVAVVADTATLATLPEREYRAGLGEVVKYALMGDAALGALLDEHAESLAEREPAVVAEAVAHGAAAKIAVVAADEQERSGLRAALNYGHTLAHALESLSGYEISHGEAVSVGLVFAGALAGALERIGPDEVERHRDLVTRLGLPARVPFETTRGAAIEAMGRDKKASGGLTFVLRGREGIEQVVDPEVRALDVAFAAVGVER